MTEIKVVERKRTQLPDDLSNIGYCELEEEVEDTVKKTRKLRSLQELTDEIQVIKSNQIKFRRSSISSYSLLPSFSPFS